MGETESTLTGGWLYGAAVQGIQGFIYQTNELKDIIGASELVEEICTLEFAKALGKKYEDLEKDNSAIVLAAGNIKYNFEEEKKCREVVLNFPMQIMQKAPGITISQAVVKWGNNTNYKDFPSAVNELESRLRIQRNKPARSLSIGATGILRSRKTGLPAVEKVKGEGEEYWDLATQKKRAVVDNEKPDSKLAEKMFDFLRNKDENEKIKVLKELSDLKVDNSWLAIIHIDGNGLGQIVQKIGSEPGKLKKFSRDLDARTTQAAAEAVGDTMGNQFSNDNVIPLRPIVLSGDDLTVICRADLALTFATHFIRHFEKATNGIVPTEPKVFDGGETYLTACGGIAFIKNAYPFYYGYNLAEALCSWAKKDSKGRENNPNRLPASCLMFHKVQSSFVEDFNEIKAKELTAKNNYSFCYGPYYLDKKNPEVIGNPETVRWSLEYLMKQVEKLEETEESRAVKNHLREWLTLLINNPGGAQQYMNRMKSITTSEWKDFLDRMIERKEGNVIYTPVYDLLSLISVKSKKQENEHTN
jgi:hypothetical protein